MAPIFLKFDELSSTHDYAISLVSKTTPCEATVIVAAHQTAGRGRYDRQWSSTPNSNLLLSCILYPKHLTYHDAFLLNIMSTLATTELLDVHNIKDSLIKWPNDVLIDNNKIAGTLIQNQLGQHHISSSVVSIGLNVNQIEWPKDPLITSMSILQRLDYEIDLIAKQWVDHLLTCYHQSKTQKGRDKLRGLWKKRLIGFRVESSYKRTNGEKFKAFLVDVLETGHLVLESQGRSMTFHMDEVRFQGHAQE